MEFTVLQLEIFKLRVGAFHNSIVETDVFLVPSAWRGLPSDAFISEHVGEGADIS